MKYKEGDMVKVIIPEYLQEFYDDLMKYDGERGKIREVLSNPEVSGYLIDFDNKGQCGYNWSPGFISLIN